MLTTNISDGKCCSHVDHVNAAVQGEVTMKVIFQILALSTYI
jgi:hypothetical protein